MPQKKTQSDPYAALPDVDSSTGSSDPYAALPDVTSAQEHEKAGYTTKIGTPPPTPGFFKRFGQSVGVPTSKE